MTKKEMWNECVGLGLVEDGVEYGTITVRELTALLDEYKSQHPPEKTVEAPVNPPQRGSIQNDPPSKSLCASCGYATCKAIMDSMVTFVSVGQGCGNYRPRK